MIGSTLSILGAETRRGVAGRLCTPMLALMMAGSCCVKARAGDWPAYRHDRSRSGITEETLKLPLSKSWVYRPRHKPRPAWGEPNPRPVGGWHGHTERRRFHFDDAYHVAVVDGAVYFGSSADGRVVSLSAETGEPRWHVLTGGPVRLAPHVWRGNVYVGSDDGVVYCLRGQDGSEQWRFHAAPRDKKVLGSGKMVSLWPVRTGVLVDNGTAYFGAGIFPAEGVYMYAVDAKDGGLVWCNDTGGAAPQSRISPQGYLLASPGKLFVPLGRVSPAAYDRRDGRLLYEAYVEHIIGGTNATLADDKLFTGTEQMIGFDQASYRDRAGWFWSHQLVVSADVFFGATGQELFAVKRKGYRAASLHRKNLLDRKRDLTRDLARAKRGPEARRKELQAEMDSLNQQVEETESTLAAGELWRVACDCEESLAMAGNVLFAGGDSKVLAYDAASGQLSWRGKIDGKARGLAVAGGRLYVSSDTGAIYCFSQPGAARDQVVKHHVDPAPYADGEMSELFEAAAERIIKKTGIDRGYCLLLGCGTGRLAYELAKRTQLHICGIEEDREKVQAARRALDAAGMYGADVTIHHGKLSQVPFSDYFANLIVSQEPLDSGRMPGGAEEAFRMLKPCGGTICIGQPAEASGRVDPLAASDARTWLAAAGIEGGTVSSGNDGMWLDFERRQLPGAGSWTHQYAEPGNSTCSDDQLVRCPLGVLWFGGPGPRQMAERHRRAAAPLAINGRLFVIGEGTADRIGAGSNSVRAYDAYNGVKLWERKIGGALRVSVTHDAGNSAANEDSLFVAVNDTCLRLDAATGETRQTYKLPVAAGSGPNRWGYVAVVGDVLYGSRTAKGRVADCVFAVAVASGRLLWKHEAAGISQGSIAIGNGRLHLAAADVTEEEHERALSARVKEVHRLNESERAALLEKLEEATVHNVVSLDAESGKLLWEKPVEVTGAAGGAYWRSLGAICKDDVLLLFGVFLDGHYWTQFLEGKFESREVVALAAIDGEPMWRKRIGYRVRPLVVGDVLHAEPWACDLRTGEQKTRVHPITGRDEPWQFARPGHHCGTPAAAPHALLFRSYTLAWYDLDKDFGTQHFGAQRPGCWINFIPANGVLMMPEASSGCLCPFANVCTVVFKSKEENRQWAYFSQPGELTPVKQLALNLGAPGDRKDKEGRLWLGYPRPRGHLVLQYEADLSFFDGENFYCHDPARLNIKDTEVPWVFRSGANGVRRVEIPLAQAIDGKAQYRVRLAFAELQHDDVGKRVFDIKVQGNVVAGNFDVFREAGGKGRAVVKEFAGVEAEEALTIEFVPRISDPEPDQLPVLQGVEVEREKALSVGCSTPSFLLSNSVPRQRKELVI